MTDGCALTAGMGPDGEGRGKVLSLAEAVRRFVHPGASIHLAYGGGRPNAAVAEIVRQYAGTRPGFTVSAHGFVNSQHALVAAGLVRHLCVAFAGENYPAPRPNPVLQRAIASREVDIENWSIWTLTARLMAGALGVEYFPVRSLADSGLEKEHDGSGYARFDPLSLGSGMGAVRALRPDVVLIHALAADAEGNVVLAAPYGEGIWGAMAAQTAVIACVEKMTDVATIRRHSAQPIVPGHVVSAVCVTPGGSHPYGLYSNGFAGVATYSEDSEFMAEVRRAARDPASFRDWVDEWVTGVRNYEEYRARVAARRPRAAPTAAGVLAEQAPQRSGRATPEERMTLVAAGVVRRRIEAAGYSSVLAGIGFSHLAAWVAARGLAEEGIAVQLLAEVGMSGFVPLPGDPYLFANQNLPTCLRLTDVADVLGCGVSGVASSCIGVLGAGQVDAAGNLNSTWADDGTFLVGSGGANDVASAAAEVVVVVKQARSRLVPAVSYITAPGRRVSTIVTTEAVFERDGDRFLLTGYLPEGSVKAAEVVDRIRARTGFEVVVAPTLAPVAEPTERELAALRAFDPDGVLLGRRKDG